MLTINGQDIIQDSTDSSYTVSSQSPVINPTAPISSSINILTSDVFMLGLVTSFIAGLIIEIVARYARRRA